MYQAGIESILGLHLRGENLVIEPCIPRAWPRYEVDFAYHGSRYEIEVGNPNGASRGVVSVELDGHILPGPGATIPLIDDGGVHRVKLVLG
jgi:cyclic beta-1,2-glucan synthetase